MRHDSVLFFIRSSPFFLSFMYFSLSVKNKSLNRQAIASPGRTGPFTEALRQSRPGSQKPAGAKG